MLTGWRELPYDAWSVTCHTLHAHTQVLGKLAAALAPPEPQLQHAALRLSGRGWETLPLLAPDGSGALVVALDLRRHHASVEHSDGRAHLIPLMPDRPVGVVTREVLAAVRDLVGPVPFYPKPQETPWTTPLDEDDEHTSYNATQGDRVLLRCDAGCPGTRVLACPIPRTLDASQRLVGNLRSRHQSVLGQARRSSLTGFHHAELCERAADPGWLVARR